MFCHKKCGLGEILWTPVYFLMALVGIMTVVGLVLSNCGKLKGNCKRLATQCGQAVENAAGAVADAIDTGNGQGSDRSSRGGKHRRGDDEDAE